MLFLHLKPFPTGLSEGFGEVHFVRSGRTMAKFTRCGGADEVFILVHTGRQIVGEEEDFVVTEFGVIETPEAIAPVVVSPLILVGVDLV